MTNEQRLEKATARLEVAGRVMTAALSRMQADADALAKASREMRHASHEFRHAFVRIATEGAG